MQGSTRLTLLFSSQRPSASSSAVDLPSHASLVLEDYAYFSALPPSSLPEDLLSNLSYDLSFNERQALCLRVSSSICDSSAPSTSSPPTAATSIVTDGDTSSTPAAAEDTLSSSAPLLMPRRTRGVKRSWVGIDDDVDDGDYGSQVFAGGTFVKAGEAERDAAGEGEEEKMGRRPRVPKRKKKMPLASTSDTGSLSSAAAASLLTISPANRAPLPPDVAFDSFPPSHAFFSPASTSFSDSHINLAPFPTAFSSSSITSTSPAAATAFLETKDYRKKIRSAMMEDESEEGGWTEMTEDVEWSGGGLGSAGAAHAGCVSTLADGYSVDVLSLPFSASSGAPPTPSPTSDFSDLHLALDSNSKPQVLANLLDFPSLSTLGSTSPEFFALSGAGSSSASSFFPRTVPVASSSTSSPLTNSNPFSHLPPRPTLLAPPSPSPDATIGTVAVEPVDATVSNGYDVVRSVRGKGGGKQCVCRTCGYACDKTTRMRDHLRTHSGEKPFGCTGSGWSVVFSF